MWIFVKRTRSASSLLLRRAVVKRTMAELLRWQFGASVAQSLWIKCARRRSCHCVVLQYRCHSYKCRFARFDDTAAECERIYASSIQLLTLNIRIVGLIAIIRLACSNSRLCSGFYRLYGFHVCVFCGLEFRWASQRIKFEFSLLRLSRIHSHFLLMTVRAIRLDVHA